MRFHSPYLLWLLGPLVLLFSWELARHATRAAATWPKIARAWAGAFDVSLGARHTTAETRPRIWLWFGLTLCLVALARPQWGVLEEQVFDQSREVLIAVDLSRSMLTQDVKPSRLDRSKLLIQSLLDGLKGERVGLVLFSGTAFLQSPLSADYEILREFLPAMSPDYLPEGGTNYHAMLEAAIQAFGTSTADRYLIILSDGDATDEDWRSMIEPLKTKGIRIIGLGVGTAQGSFIPDTGGGFVKDERGAVVLARLNSSTLQELAQLTGGVYTDASAWIDLPGLLKKTVESGHKGDFSEKNTARLIERFQWFLAPGLVLLLISFWAEFPVRPRERALPLAAGGRPRTPGRKLPAATTVAAALLLFAGGLAPRTAGAAPAPVPSKDDQTTEDVFTAPLRRKVIELATKDEVSAKDFASFADTTITFANRLSASQLKVPEKPLKDALQAVDKGEQLDAKAADWPHLRKELEELLKKEDPPKPEQKKPDNDQQKQDQSKQDQQKQNQQKNGQPDKDQPQPGQPKQQPDQSPPGQQKPPQAKPDAFGDMRDQKTPKPEAKPQPPQPGTRKVGGQTDKKPEELPQNPELAMPLQKLEQVRNQDSPARLQQLMQGQPQKTTPPAKDW